MRLPWSYFAPFRRYCRFCAHDPHSIAHVGVSPSMNLKLISREIIFEIFQPMWWRYLNVMDRRTDDILWHTALCVASRSYTRKLSYRKDDCAMRPIYGCPENFRESLSTPTATFSEIFNGLLFRSILWKCVHLKFVALPVPGIIAIEVFGGGCESPILRKRRP